MGLAVLALVQITISDFDLPFHFSHQFIFFLAPFLAYNFIKFHRFLWKKIDSIIKWPLFLIGFSAFSIFMNIRSKFKKIRVFVPLLIINVWAFYVNTWVAINGMGIPYGKQFHIFLAILIIANYFVFRRYTNLKEVA